MNKQDILKGDFDEDSIDALTHEEKSDLIYSFHSKEEGAYSNSPLKDLNEEEIENIIKFLKLCMKTNQDNVEWFLLHILDRISNDTYEKNIKFTFKFKDVKTFNLMTKYYEKKYPYVTKEDIYNVWIFGHNHRPLQDEILRLQKKREDDIHESENKK